MCVFSKASSNDKYQSMTLNSKGCASTGLTSKAKAFQNSFSSAPLLQWRDFLKKPLWVVVAETLAITSVHRFSGQKWWMIFLFSSVGVPAQTPLGFATWLLLYTFTSCWIFTCHTCAMFSGFAFFQVVLFLSGVQPGAACWCAFTLMAVTLLRLH